VAQFIPRVWPLILQFRVFTAPINILFPSRFVPEATQIHAGLRHYGLRSAVYVYVLTRTRAYMHAARRRTRVGLDSRETEALCSNAVASENIAVCAVHASFH